MKIEDEIKQDSFPSQYLKVHVNLLYTAAWASLAIAQVLKPFNISPQQFNILRILRGKVNQPASIRELTDRMIDKSSNASRLVDKLIQKKLVVKEACNSDNRKVEVVITAEGMSLVNEASLAVEAEIQKLFSLLSDDEAAQLSDLLDKIRG